MNPLLKLVLGVAVISLVNVAIVIMALNYVNLFAMLMSAFAIPFITCILVAIWADSLVATWADSLLK